MKTFKKILPKLIIILLLLTFSSCIAAKMQKLEGKTKFEMLNKLGSPDRIISRSNGQAIYVYYFEDYSDNNYASVIGLMYVNSNDKIISVEKEKTRLSLEQFLNFRNLY